MASIVKVDKIAQASGTPEFTIPTADGTAKSALITDGSGVLSFATGTPSSSNFLRGDGTWQAVTTTALTGSTNTWIPTITGANALTGTANFTYYGNTLDVKNSGTASSIKLYCETSNQHYQEIKAAPHSGSSNWTLTLPGNDGDADQFLQTNGSGVTAWATAGGGGLTVGDQWRLTTGFSGTSNPITSNLERVDDPNQATLGSPMTESSGVFTFPETGYYLVTAAMCGGIQNATERSHGINISVTINNSTWENIANATNNGFDSNDETTYSARCTLIVDVTDTANVKVRFYATTVNSSSVTKGSTDDNLTTFTFLRLADT